MNQPAAEAGLGFLLDHLRRERGTDWSSYKPASLARRVTRRMHLLGLTSYDQYVAYLRSHPAEYDLLWQAILIKVTSFFRDPSYWECLATQVIPRLLESSDPQKPIRVWSAGCASGQEAFSLAMLLAEALEPQAFSRRVKIFATDVDESALAQTRQGVYAECDLQPVPPPLRQRYFAPVPGKEQFAILASLRRAVVVGRHDLLVDPPISHLDLLCCRNTLIYMTPETQARLLERFHGALNETGILFLGKAETVLYRPALFIPVEFHYRIFRKA